MVGTYFVDLNLGGCSLISSYSCDYILRGDIHHLNPKKKKIFTDCRSRRSTVGQIDDKVGNGLGVIRNNIEVDLNLTRCGQTGGAAMADYAKSATDRSL